MVFCAKAPEADTPDCFPGVLGHAVSQDLNHWTCLPPMKIRGVASTMECPEIFRCGNRRVLLYYWHDTRFRTADSLEGPWERGDLLTPDSFDFFAGRHMYDGNRHILIGWLPRRDCDCHERTWGGNMLFPREIRMQDGRHPRSRFVRKIDQLFAKTAIEMLPQKAALCGQGWEITEDGFHADAAIGGTLLAYPTMPDTCLIRAEIIMTSSHGTVTFLLGTHPDYQNEYWDQGYQILLDAAENQIRIRKHYIWDQRNDIASLSYPMEAGKPIRLEILRNKGILEIGIDESRTLVTRLLDDKSSGFGISAQDTQVDIRHFSVHTPIDSE